jgi:uncharacterized protein
LKVAIFMAVFTAVRLLHFIPMTQLTPDECRVLGVLIEKELTTPANYPLSLNALVDGSNQKNNRDPVVSFDEGRVFDAVESLRAKGIVVRVEQHGSRVSKYRHETVAKLSLNRYELVLLAELLLRGPQTMGELRGRASRMHHLDTLEVVREMLGTMAGREEPLVKQVPPSPGSRAERYVQLLCPDAHPIDGPGGAEVVGEASAMPSNRSMSDRIDKLEGEVRELRGVVRRMATALGEADPFPGEPA